MRRCFSGINYVFHFTSYSVIVARLDRRLSFCRRSSSYLAPSAMRRLHSQLNISFSTNSCRYVPGICCISFTDMYTYRFYPNVTTLYVRVFAVANPSVVCP